MLRDRSARRMRRSEKASASAPQMRHHLDLRRLRKHIQRRDGLQPVPARHRLPRSRASVAGIAGDVNELLRRHGRSADRARAAETPGRRRIENHRGFLPRMGGAASRPGASPRRPRCMLPLARPGAVARSTANSFSSMPMTFGKGRQMPREEPGPAVRIHQQTPAPRAPHVSHRRRAAAARPRHSSARSTRRPRARRGRSRHPARALARISASASFTAGVAIGQYSTSTSSREPCAKKPTRPPSACTRMRLRYAVVRRRADDRPHRHLFQLARPAATSAPPGAPSARAAPDRRCAGRRTRRSARRPGRAARRGPAKPPPR